MVPVEFCSNPLAKVRRPVVFTAVVVHVELPLRVTLPTKSDWLLLVILNAPDPLRVVVPVTVKVPAAVLENVPLFTSRFPVIEAVPI